MTDDRWLAASGFLRIFEEYLIQQRDLYDALVQAGLEGRQRLPSAVINAPEMARRELEGMGIVINEPLQSRTSRR